RIRLRGVRAEPTGATSEHPLLHSLLSHHPVPPEGGTLSRARIARRGAGGLVGRRLRARRGLGAGKSRARREPAFGRGSPPVRGFSCSGSQAGTESPPYGCSPSASCISQGRECPTPRRGSS